MLRRSRCLSVNIRMAEELLRTVKELGVLETSLKPKRVGDRLLIPLRSGVSNDIIKQLLVRFNSSECIDLFEESLRHVTYRDLLKGMLPDDVVNRLPASYEIIGNAALIQLPEDLMVYAPQVAKAIMRVAKNVKAVYAAGQVGGPFRTRELRLIGGEAVDEVIHKEYGIRIKVNLPLTYYNASLAEEHRRIAASVYEGEVVADLFCGVGPFTLHIISLVNALVYSVDINPYAIKCLIESIKLNRGKIKGLAIPLNIDAREFLEWVDQGVLDRVIMNLPHKAHEFLRQATRSVRKGGIIHLYIIAGSAEEAVGKALSQVAKSLKPARVLRVLDYAPRRYIFRVDLIKDA